MQHAITNRSTITASTNTGMVIFVGSVARIVTRHIIIATLGNTQKIKLMSE